MTRNLPTYRRKCAAVSDGWRVVSEGYGQSDARSACFVLPSGEYAVRVPTHSVVSTVKKYSEIPEDLRQFFHDCFSGIFQESSFQFYTPFCACMSSATPDVITPWMRELVPVIRTLPNHESYLHILENFVIFRTFFVNSQNFPKIFGNIFHD